MNSPENTHDDATIQGGEVQKGEKSNPRPDSGAEVTAGGRVAGLFPGDPFVNRVSTLHEIALMIDAAHSRDEIFGVLRKETKWLLSHDVCFLCLTDLFRNRYTITTLSPLADSAGLNGFDFSIGEEFPGTVLQTQSPLTLDLSGHTEPGGPIERSLTDLGMKSLLAVPLRTGDEIIGCLAVASAMASAYHEEEQVVAQILGTHIAISLANGSLFDDAKKRIAQIELVNELAAKVTATLEIDDLLASVAESVRKSCNYFDVTIFLVNADERAAVLVAHAGHYADFVPRGYRQNLSEGIVGWVAATGERVLANEVADNPHYIALDYHHTRSELALPIRIHHEVVGVLNVEDDRPQAFDETDATVLETLCDQLGSVIHNAQLYEQLKRTNAKLTELDEMKSNFLGIVSHDFRSPLASIILAARSLLTRDPLNDRQRLQNYLTVIVDQATKLSNLAEDTLSIARMESGKLKCLLGVVNLDRLIRDAAAQVNFTRRHSLDLDVAGSLSLVRGDQSKLRQVVQNLLSNAVKYSPSGGTVQVRVEEYSGDQLMVSVLDQGIGIPSNQMERLFQKFSRVDSPEVREIKGSGLGLWICKEIVEAHEGKIWAESQQGKGSAFHFTLKKVRTESSQDTRAAHAPPPPA